MQSAMPNKLASSQPLLGGESWEPYLLDDRGYWMGRVEEVGIDWGAKRARPYFQFDGDGIRVRIYLEGVGSRICIYEPSSMVDFLTNLALGMRLDDPGFLRDCNIEVVCSTQP